MKRASLLYLLLSFALSACGDDTANGDKVCEPDDTRVCSCEPGPEGTETCNADGTGWGACDCPQVDAGDDDGDGGTVTDEGPEDAGEEDAGTEDAGEEDAGEEDAGEEDAGEEDAGEEDAGEEDAGEEDAGEEDAGEEDAGEEDAGIEDAGGDPSPDAGTDGGADDAGFGDFDPEYCPPTPDLQPYSAGVCPAIIGGPTQNDSYNENFVVRGVDDNADQVEHLRSFRLIVPNNYDGSEPWPLMMSYHWINASGASLIRDGEIETAAEEMEMLVLAIDSLQKPGTQDREYLLDWPFGWGVQQWQRDMELIAFDDLLTCISEQYNIDPCRVYGLGVSAGGLWISYLSTTERANYLASVASLSGGLGEVEIFGDIVWSQDYAPQPNKFPTLVLWGGPVDFFIINFQTASVRYGDELLNDNHFVFSCVHSSGHGVPPIEHPCPDPTQCTRFRSIWTFFKDHHYGLPPGWSPYLENGIPEDMPDWQTDDEWSYCGIGMPPP